MSLRRCAIAAILAVPLLLAGCGGDNQNAVPSSSSTSATSTTSSVTSSTPTEEQEPEPVTEEAVAEPYMLYCLEGMGGMALWSNGEQRYVPGCDVAPSHDELYPHDPNRPGGAPVPGSMQEQVAEGCRSGQLVGPDCAQFM